MGNDKTTQSSNQTATATPEEQEYNKMLLARQKMLEPYLQEASQAGLEQTTNLITGQGLTGAYGNLMEGMSEEAISRTIKNAIGDVAPGFQASGVYDSGMRAEAETELSADMRAEAEQYNQNLLFQLLSLGLTGSANAVATNQSAANQLSTNLAGLRTISGSTTTKAMNPFLKSFQQSYGEGMGTGAAAGTFAVMCWVAKEIYGSWEHPKTHNFRYFLLNISPVWFRELYRKHGEEFAKFISNKPIIKLMLRPFFEIGSIIGKIESIKNENRLGII